MSLGAEGGMSQGNSPSTDAAIAYAYNAGVAIFAATANSNASTIAYPSNHEYVISVGASSPSGERKSDTSSDGESWWGSNYGVNIQDDKNAVDIMAPTILPTTDITGTGNGYNTSSDYYMWFNGTSCATPYAAGVAALLLSNDATLTPAELRNALTSTATDMTFDGGIGWDRYTGYGMVNANAAILSLNPAIPICQITAPGNFSIIDLGTLINVHVSATDNDGTISKVEFYLDDALSPEHTDYTAPYTWTWDTSIFEAGDYQIRAIAQDNENNVDQAICNVTLLAAADEGFESGDFSGFNWTNNSSIPWGVQDTTIYSGTYAAQSGSISHDGSSSLSISIDVIQEGTLSFLHKVSSESNYDFLRFSIDGILQNQWSGEQHWALTSYNVLPGPKTFTWTYSKDEIDSSGDDCAWIDHIVFPPHDVYFAPPQNLTAVGANQIVTLNWQAPVSGIPTSYKIYRDDVYYDSTTNLTYDDETVTNGQNYSYYVTAVYGTDESEPTATIAVTPNLVSEAIIASGSVINGSSTASPINIYYKSLHGQSIYTKADLNNAGIIGPVEIISIGFDVYSAPDQALPNFIIRMKHSSDPDVSSWQTSTDLVTVYSRSSYLPNPGGYDMLILDTPFSWNGNDNLVLDTAFSQTSAWDDSGQVYCSNRTNGYKYIRSDTADQTNIFNGGYNNNNLPNIKIVFQSDPEIQLSTDSLAFGSILNGSSSNLSFTITNNGGSTLSGSVTYPDGFVVNETEDRAEPTKTRASLDFDIEAGTSVDYTVTFNPSVAGEYAENLIISHNVDEENRFISLSGYAYDLLEVPFVDGFETGISDWQIVNGDQVNQWHWGNSINNTGSYSVYVSNDNGLNNAYTIDSASITHIYRDIAFPESTEDFYLRFNWLANGDSELGNPEAGVLLSEGSILDVDLLTQSDWKNQSVLLPENLAGTNQRLVFTWSNNDSNGDQPPAAIDNIRIVTEENADAAVIIDEVAETDLPPVTDPSNNVITSSIVITGVLGDNLQINVGYASITSPYTNAGLDIHLSGATFGGANVMINHNLGFIPNTLAYKLGDGSWSLIQNPGAWDDQSAWFDVSATKNRSEDLFIVFSDSSDHTLPVTLSNFAAIYLTTGSVRLNWTTATETGVMGYYILRAEQEDLATALIVSSLIEAQNSSNQMSYSYQDHGVLPNNSYYYWLQSRDFNGVEYLFGPLNILTSYEHEDPAPDVPAITQILGNYPNPFNPKTNLRYSLAKAAEVSIRIYNNRGQLVRTFSQLHRTPGFYNIIFDGKDFSGRELSSGVYYYSFDAGEHHSTHRMLLLK